MRSRSRRKACASLIALIIVTYLLYMIHQLSVCSTYFEEIGRRGSRLWFQKKASKWQRNTEDNKEQSAPFDPKDPDSPFPRPEQLRFLVEPDMCSDTIRMILFIISHPSDFQRRKEIRHSWANSSNFDNAETKIVFILGRSTNEEDSFFINVEAKKFGDIVQADVEEGYYHLSEKTLAGLEWARRKCTNAQCTVKADSDNVIHIENMKQRCLEYNEPGIFGNCDIDREVIRYSSKWRIPNNVYFPNLYPRYCSTNYAFAGGIAAIEGILRASDLTSFYHSSNLRMLPEDALFTGIFADIAQLKRKTVPGFIHTDNPKIHCAGDQALIHSVHLGHNNHPEEVWETMKQSNNFCKKT